MTEESQQTSAPRKKFETIFEHANDAIFIVDVDNDSIVDCNPAAEELVEYSQEELESMPASDLHPHNLDKFMEFAETVFEQGEGWTDEITCYCKSGDIIPAEMSASVIELDGRPHLVNHVRETTERQERDWFEALIEHSRDLITVVKPDGSIRYQSPSIEHTLGYEPATLRDKAFTSYVHPEDTETVREILDAMAEGTGLVTRRVEFRFRRADNSWAWLESVGSHRPESPITGYVLNSREITAQKESQQQAVVLNRMLRHNLRNELNVILGHANAIARDGSAEVTPRAEAITNKAWDLYDASSYAKDLADILETHHITQRRHDVTALIEQTVAQLRQDVPDAKFDLDMPAHQRVTAGPKLDIAFEQVLENAIEHNDADTPQVTVTVDGPESNTEDVSITIADNGPGIPIQEQEVLSEGDESPLNHGSGLGLWLVNWIVTRSGGQIHFAENDPRGSQVTITLPPAD